MNKSSREKILTRIRTGLYGSTGVHQQKEITRKSTGISAEPTMEKSILVNQFVEELTKVSGNAKIVESEDAVKDFIMSFVEERGISSFAIWKSELIQRLEIGDDLQSKGLKLAHPDKKEEMSNAGIGITEADFAIADTGTIVLIAGEKQPRTVSLIPPIHLAIVKSSLILRNINDLFAMLVNLISEKNSTEESTSCLTFITGPSRTADIELNLTLGVHGPRELFVLILAQ
ncbi:MAG TPA: lactate utilization protein [Thermodesulfobacteriota bacterium]|nr:lactate utilization protein [Thermodesulfobacteriota bacterium]